MIDLSSVEGVLSILVPEDNRCRIKDLEGVEYSAKLNFPVRTTTKCVRALNVIAKSCGDDAEIQDILMSGLASEEGEQALEDMFIAMYGKTIWKKVKKATKQANPDEDEPESPLDVFDVGEFLDALGVGLGKQSSKISGAVIRIMEVIEAAMEKLEPEKDPTEPEAPESN